MNKENAKFYVYFALQIIAKLGPLVVGALIIADLYGAKAAVAAILMAIGAANYNK